MSEPVYLAELYLSVAPSLPLPPPSPPRSQRGQETAANCAPALAKHMAFKKQIARSGKRVPSRNTSDKNLGMSELSLSSLWPEITWTKSHTATRLIIIMLTRSLRGIITLLALCLTLRTWSPKSRSGGSGSNQQPRQQILAPPQHGHSLTGLWAQNTIIPAQDGCQNQLRRVHSAKARGSVLQEKYLASSNQASGKGAMQEVSYIQHSESSCKGSAPPVDGEVVNDVSSPCHPCAFKSCTYCTNTNMAPDTHRGKQAVNEKGIKVYPILQSGAFIAEGPE